MKHSSPWEANSHSASREIPHVLWNTRRFITVFKRARHWSISWARCFQSTLYQTICLRSILIFSSYLRLGLPSSLFSSGFTTKILYAFLISLHECYMPYPSYSLHLITVIICGEAYNLWSSFLCTFLQLPVISSFLLPDIPLFLNTHIIMFPP